jgi:sodium-dependent dicarboxylate transporter 2/3/5
MKGVSVARWGAPLVALILYFLLPESLSSAGRATSAVGLWMAIWWLSEAIPLPATALLPIALFPLLGVSSMRDAASPYAHKLIFLFMGGFMIAGAMQRWNLHRRVALWTVLRVGTRPDRIVGGFMLATAFLSMWVSNTATALMMTAIGASIVDVVVRSNEENEDGGHFAVCLMLGIAYAASIGGMATLIGTPPNALLAAFLEQEYGMELSFGRWMLFASPLTVFFLPVCWWLLTRRIYPVKRDEESWGHRRMEGLMDELGPMSPPEKRVGFIFSLVACAWMFRPLLFKGVEDAGIAIVGALALFVLPAGGKEAGRLLDWKTAEKLPWGILLIFGGGLSLASAISHNGVSEFLGHFFVSMEGSGLLLLFLVTVLIVLLTEMTSNTATTAAFLPILGAVALGAGVAKEGLLAAAALAASCAFMMPVATPPNAIVFGSGYVSIRQMMRAGIWLNITAVILIVAWAHLLAGPLLG